MEKYADESDVVTLFNAFKANSESGRIDFLPWGDTPRKGKPPVQDVEIILGDISPDCVLSFKGATEADNLLVRSLTEEDRAWSIYLSGAGAKNTIVIFKAELSEIDKDRWQIKAVRDERYPPQQPLASIEKF